MTFDENYLRGPGLTWHKAYLLAEACKLSYEQNPQKVIDTLRRDWDMSSRVFSFGQTQGFTAVGEKSLIVAFRGTQGFSDWGSNLNVLPREHSCIGANVHGGFLEQWQAAAAEVNATLSRYQNAKSIWITGHSLGGAVALMSAIAQQGRTLDGVVTFGQPRALGSDAARAVGALLGSRYIRIVNSNDVVARIPRSYSHTGGLLHFDGDGELKTDRTGGGRSLESVLSTSDNGPEPLSEAEQNSLETYLDANDLKPDGTLFTSDGRELEGARSIISDHRMDAYVMLMRDKAFPRASESEGARRLESAVSPSSSIVSHAPSDETHLSRLGDSYVKALKHAAERLRDFKEARDPTGRSLESLTGQAEPERMAESHLEGLQRGFFGSEGRALEAIVRSELRPAYFIHRDKIIMEKVPNPRKIFLSDTGFEHLELLQSNRSKLEEIAMGVGRVDVFGFGGTNVGTGWVVGDGRTLVTNRHVAEVFVHGDARFGWDIFPGIRAELNTLAQINTMPHHISDRERPFDAKIERVLYVAGISEPDFAILELSQALPPLTLSRAPAKLNEVIAVIGYPAEDQRDNDPELIRTFFGETFDVKRCAPGVVTAGGSTTGELFHDASTLGGNSGSAVIGLESGTVVGLHFAGSANVRNYAVPGNVVQAALDAVRNGVFPGSDLNSAPVTEDAEEAPANTFTDRNGYNADFLGTCIPLPTVADETLAANIAPLLDGSGTELKYRNFSVLQNGARRLPLLTAVNIEGARLRRLPRKDSWKLDGRIDRAHQVGNVLYKHNPLDRGHMVRRLDPCWAPDGIDDSIVLQAQADTYFYTNATPQHKDLNQRDWVGLEDYVLDNAEQFGFRATVFTGPVFNESDRVLRDQAGANDIAIPEEFWKVVAMRNTESGALTALGYVLSHGPMIANLLKAEFVLGAYETYQVPIKLIAERTGLDFGSIVENDPLNSPDPLESLSFATSVRRITGPDAVRFD